MSVFTTPGPITATLITAGARVRVVASERPDTVVRVEPVDSANSSDVKVAEKTKVGFGSGELSVKTTKSGAKDGSVAITVELPAGSSLVLSTAWTEVHAEGVLGDCRLDMSSGRVRLDRIAALRGNLAAGEVAVGHVAGPVDIEGGAAGVRIGVVGGVVRYAGSSGSFDIDRADGDVTAKAAGCPIRIGRMTRGQAELMNASGGIEVGISEGTVAWVDADSTKGSVRNSLPTQDNPAGVDVKVHARTRLDDIVIHRATS